MAKRLEIVWSDQAILQLDKVLKHLYENWSDKAVKSFLNAIEGFEEIATRFPEIYPQSQLLKGYRKALLGKQISIIYSVDKTAIKIYTLFDNRQNPDKLK